ncbi:RimK family alpha-L-glutamate ligase [uncultured Rummeliibacillus sp.]|uniref:ATP-grasp domain-containing protein n=1 Tax=uncultured Rummeliibacillus sp. TaxID=762292 RepID=UPI002605C565|nr:ATP-grasp domain-containing protein [uncultured Rummeliibacillus sp.]
MEKAYLIYEREDSKKNTIFIEQMIAAARGVEIELILAIADEIEQNIMDIPFNGALFVWNRTRNPEIAKKLESIGIKVFNRSTVNELANNKKETLKFAHLHGIPTVPILREEQIQQYPIIIKTIDGHGGNEVALCNSSEDLKFFQLKWRGRKLLTQPYIETNSTDVRVWVVGSKIIGAVKRKGSHDFRSNYTLGGSIEKYNLSHEQRLQVLTLQKALNSNYIGIDFLLRPDGKWLLNEIEDPVGARSFYNLYDEDLPTILMDYFVQELEGL